MFSKFIRLEIKEFFRSPQLSSGIVMKISMLIMVLYFASIFFFGAFGLYYGAQEEGENPLQLFCRFFLFYWVADLLLKYFFQNLPANNIKPFLTMKISRKTVTAYTFAKIFVSFFSWAFLLFAVPFTILVLTGGNYSALGILGLMFSAGCLVFINTCINLVINKNNTILYSVFALIIGFGLLHYFKIIDVTAFSEHQFMVFYKIPILMFLPLALLAAAVYFSFKSIRKSLYLDKALELKKSAGKTEDIAFLKRFGTLGVFINNDIRLLKRSKTARSAALGSLFFLMYGFMFFSGTYKAGFMQVFMGIFITGGFNFIFGQRVPAWDSSYYPLMMTLNVPYRDYLKAKWYLFVIFTLVAMLVSAVYALFSWQFYLVILASGMYNLGANSYLTLFAGAFNKKPIDLDSGRKALSGGQQNFNIKLILLLIPQMLLPMGVFALTDLLFGFYPALLSVAMLGCIGFLLRNYIFEIIVKLYRSEKYTTIAAFGKSNK